MCVYFKQFLYLYIYTYYLVVINNIIFIISLIFKARAYTLIMNIKKKVN